MWAVGGTALVAALAAGFHFDAQRLAVDSADSTSTPSPRGAGFTLSFTDFTLDRAPQGLSVVETGRNEYGASVSDGQFFHGASREPDAATYLQYDNQSPVNRVGATVGFPGKDTEGRAVGSVALIVADAPIPGADGASSGPAAHSGVHLVATSSSWTLSVWAPDTGDQPLGSGRYSSIAGRGQHSFEVVLAGDQATVRLPNGEARAFQDPRIGDLAAGWAAWALYEKDPGTASATITTIWAD